MTRITTEILVVGGGIAGLIATAAFATSGFDTLCIDPETPSGKPDQRSTAFLMPSVQLLQQAGLWAALAPKAAALQIMRLIDGDPDTQTIRESVDFKSTEIGLVQFGFNLPNTVLRSEISAQLGKLSNANLAYPASFKHLTPRSASALVRLTDGRTIETKLVIAADGRHSALRDQIGITSKTLRYGQRGMVFSVQHPEPHRNISSEIHYSGGPFTLVPLADPGQSAVVWMDHSAKASRLMALPDAEFEQAASIRSCHILGPLTLISTRAMWPIISQLASKLNGPRTALVAETAHVVPPIGAQGLNTSLGDISLLLDLVKQARSSGQDIGSAELLDTYSRQRLPVLRTRIAGIDALNRAAMATSLPIRDLRRLGLTTLHAAEPLRKTAMRLGLG